MLGESPSSICVAPFPTARNEWRDLEAEAQMAVLRNVALGVRSLRAEHNVPANAKMHPITRVDDPAHVAVLEQKRAVPLRLDGLGVVAVRPQSRRDRHPEGRRPLRLRGWRGHRPARRAHRRRGREGAPPARARRRPRRSWQESKRSSRTTSFSPARRRTSSPRNVASWTSSAASGTGSRQASRRSESRWSTPTSRRLLDRLAPVRGQAGPRRESSACSPRLGHPERSFPSVHVTGTNGKGSVVAMLASILQAAGYRVGRYTSPDVVDFRDRICVDGRWISEIGVRGCGCASRAGVRRGGRPKPVRGADGDRVRALPRVERRCRRRRGRTRRPLRRDERRPLGPHGPDQRLARPHGAARQRPRRRSPGRRPGSPSAALRCSSGLSPPACEAVVRSECAAAGAPLRQADVAVRRLGRSESLATFAVRRGRSSARGSAPAPRALSDREPARRAVGRASAARCRVLDPRRGGGRRARQGRLARAMGGPRVKHRR